MPVFRVSERYRFSSLWVFITMKIWIEQGSHSDDEKHFGEQHVPPLVEEREEDHKARNSNQHFPAVMYFRECLVSQLIGKEKKSHSKSEEINERSGKKGIQVIIHLPLHERCRRFLPTDTKLFQPLFLCHHLVGRSHFTRRKIIHALDGYEENKK